MHVLRRPDLRHAVAVGAPCAVLAVVLTLLVAGTLNEFGSSSPSRSPAPAPASVYSTSTEPGWNWSPLRSRNMFRSLMRSPGPVLWSSGS